MHLQAEPEGPDREDFNLHKPMKTTFTIHGLSLAAILFAASLRQAPAQNVYSINVVGYYNVTLNAGWNLLSCELADTNANANYAIHPSDPAAEGSLLYRFDPVSQTYYDAGTYFNGFGWCPVSGNTNDPALNVPPGEGFLLWTPQSWVLTIVGEVLQGTLVNPLPAQYSLKASLVPEEGLLQADLGFPSFAGDQVWRRVASVFTNYWYDDSASAWEPAEPRLVVGEGFFLYRSPDQATTNHWWVRNFTVQDVSPAPALVRAITPAIVAQPPPTLGLAVRNGNAVLTQNGVIGAQYSVQFSTDRRSWQTVATVLGDTVWQEPLRGGPRGFYRLASL